MNDNNPTYCRSNNVLDLTICSSNLVKYCTNFKVLKNNISDHRPIIASLSNIHLEHTISAVSKVDWQKFKTLLSSKNVEPSLISNRETLNQEVCDITNTINNALSDSKVLFSFTNKNKPIVTLPQHVLGLIKQKRKLRKIFQESQSQEHKKVLNAITNKLKKILRKVKSTKLKNEFIELAQFNQSSSKHWAVLNNLENENRSRVESITLTVENKSIKDKYRVSEIFADNLAGIFSNQDTPVFDNQPAPDNPVFSTFEYISTKEIYDSIKTIDKIIDFCKTWGFAINVSKTCYTTFTTAGQRQNYHKNYKLKLTVLDSEIPLDANPTFLGIKLDPKLSFKPHLQDLENKLTSKTSLLRRIKNFKWSNSLSINLVLYKSLIRSLFDYCFYFPLKTPIRTIHKILKLETIEERANNLFLRFLSNKSKQVLIAKEIEQFMLSEHPNLIRFSNPFDKLSFN
ncbi:RNA-directed DNA polymerase from mobile element jockey-like [Brachionus plicatilis]|uniref:RNA-directed DNA polymerase from mobile element jockey-like n=1 Tax=Brachionus plicatilis TaxID=10195 RepID=A0A3M7QMP6_BRAPC|nr:RNA-directed DNA polymerase from mobile element jockey-like [Brachionus plicatilis]